MREYILFMSVCSFVAYTSNATTCIFKQQQILYISVLRFYVRSFMPSLSSEMQRIFLYRLLSGCLSFHFLSCIYAISLEYHQSTKWLEGGEEKSRIDYINLYYISAHNNVNVGCQCVVDTHFI